jgi:hypothetical protein
MQHGANSAIAPSMKAATTDPPKKIELSIPSNPNCVRFAAE